MRISHRINKIYNKHKAFLEDTGAGENIRSFLTIPLPTRDDINDLRVTLDQYKDTLGPGKIWLFINIDHVLKIAENNLRFQQIGFTPIVTNIQHENQDGLNHVITINGALGNGNVTNIIKYGDKDITSIIGNKKLSGITLVNVTKHTESGGISAYFSSFVTMLSNAIGKMATPLKTSITISECDEANNIVGVIYEAPTKVAVVDCINGFLACNRWVAARNNSYYLTETDESGCLQVVGASNALTKCTDFLHVHDEL